MIGLQAHAAHQYIHVMKNPTVRPKNMPAYMWGPPVIPVFVHKNEKTIVIKTAPIPAVNHPRSPDK